MSRQSKVALLTFVCVLFFLAVVVGGGGIVEVAFTVVFGWVSFLKRTLPRISFNWDITGMAMICVVGILFVGHSFLDRLTRHIAASRGQTWKWPRKWTYCGLIAIGLLFFVGMSVGGAVHQIGWIASSPEPMFERKGDSYEELIVMKELAVELHDALADPDITAVRRCLWNSDEVRYRGKSQLQSLHVLFVVSDSGKVAGLIVFPRDPQSKARMGGFYIDIADIQPVPSAKLPELLQKHQGHLVAL